MSDPDWFLSPREMSMFLRRSDLRAADMDTLRLLARHLKLRKGIDAMGKRQLVNLVFWRLRRPDIRHGG